MAIGSSVYQPTTVSYEPRPGSLLSQTTAASPLQVLRKPYVQWILLTLGILSISFGKSAINMYMILFCVIHLWASKQKNEQSKQ